MQRSRINATKYITLFVRKYQDPDTQEWKSFGNTMPIKRVNIPINYLSEKNKVYF